MSDQPHYPYRDGNHAVLGPDVIATADGMTICWKGAKYRRDHGEHVGAATPLICSDERHAAKVAALQADLDRYEEVVGDLNETLVDRAKQAARAEAEIDRLRAGEEPGWNPLLEPTPGQWINRWNQASPETRLLVAADCIANTAAAARCFMLDHESRLADERHAWVAVARVRDVIADMERITGARHWARILRKATEGPEPAAPAATEPGHVITVEGNPAAAAEAIRQMDADPHGLKAGMIVQPYRDHGEQKWVFRCWGTDTCDGSLSLDHYSEQSAERARDRHVAEEHAEPTEPATITDPEYLRSLYTAAIQRCVEEGNVRYAHIAAAILDVHDRHIQQLQQRLQLADQAHRELAATLDRVRALHADEYGSCSHCTRADSVLWPCPTIRALDQHQEQP